MKKIELERYIKDEAYQSQFPYITLSYIDTISSIKEELDFLGVEWEASDNLHELIASFKSDEFILVDADGVESNLYQVTDLRKL